jgi:hypothetical protein
MSKSDQLITIGVDLVILLLLAAVLFVAWWSIGKLRKTARPGFTLVLGILPGLLLAGLFAALNIMLIWNLLGAL